MERKEEETIYYDHCIGRISLIKRNEELETVLEI